MQTINVILFDNFTTLDALGPTEVLSKMKEQFEIQYYSLKGGLIMSSTGASIETRQIRKIQQNDLVMIPGGFGTRELVNDEVFIKALKELAESSKHVLSICTGSALLAKTQLLNNKEATSNKLSWDWVTSQNQNVLWKRKARWVVDDKFYTSSGITAGIDMTLGFIADTFSKEIAKKISIALEYIWNEDKDNDPFA